MRKKAIAYSLFGYGKERQADSFDFNSYLRGFMINIRMNRLLFPGFDIILETDQDTAKTYGELFKNVGVIVHVNEPAPLCLAMLWRLKPAFEEEDGRWKYSHVLCRDTDSPPTYREAQAVEYWIRRDRSLHAITDSVSHNIPLLGGMIGVRPDYFAQRTGCHSWKEMISKSSDVKWERKGSDQTFLNSFVYPKFAQPGSDSITQHYFNGMGNTFLNDYKTCTCPPTHGHDSRCINNIELTIPFEYSESNAVCGHIGSAGHYSTEMFRFLRKHQAHFTDILKEEKKFPIEFYWTQDGTFDVK